MDIILTEEFNFPLDVVTWDKSKACTGVDPIPKKGETEQKKGFWILDKMAEVHNLTQVIEKITHGKDIIDLVYTNYPLSVLEETNWKEELGPAANIKNFGRNMEQCIVNATIRANVPKFKWNRGGREETTDQVLRHKKLNAELESSKLTLTDKETRTPELHEVNEAIGNKYDELQEIEEQRISDKVKIKAEDFYSYV